MTQAQRDACKKLGRTWARFRIEEDTHNGVFLLTDAKARVPEDIVEKEQAAHLISVTAFRDWEKRYKRVRS